MLLLVVLLYLIARLLIAENQHVGNEVGQQELGHRGVRPHRASTGLERRPQGAPRTGD